MLADCNHFGSCTRLALTSILLGSITLAQDPNADSLVLSGSLASTPPNGTVPGAIVPAQGLIQLRVVGPDPLTFEIDLNSQAIRDGYIRVYERESDSYPIYDGGMSYRDTVGIERETAWLAGRATFLGAWTNGHDLVYMDYEDDIAGGFGGGGGVHHRRQVVRLVGRCLELEVIDLDQSTLGDGVYAGFFYGAPVGLDSHQTVEMQGALGYPLKSFVGPANSTWYWANCMDLYQTEASTWFLGNNVAGSIDWGMNTFGRYKKNSAGQIHASVHDRIQIAVSQRLDDCFVLNKEGGSPYKDFLSRRLVVLFDGGFDQWDRYDTLFGMFEQWGLVDIVGYVFGAWSASPPDCGAEERGPDWFPAKNPSQWLAMCNKAEDVGIALGANMRFTGLNPFSTDPIYNVPADFARFANGVVKTEFQHCLPDPPPLLFGTGAQAFHSLREHTLVKANYGHTAAYIDAMTYASPTGGAFGEYVDETAGSPHGHSVAETIADQKKWMDEARRIVGGPMLGEGSISTPPSNTEWIWSGYVDSVQRHINTGAYADGWTIPAGSPRAITAWPVIPEFELRATMRSQANHGNGFYYRFFGPVDGPQMVQPSGYHHIPLRLPMHDRYRAYEITYGHTPFFEANGIGDGLNTGNTIYFPQMIQEYYQLLELSRRAFAYSIDEISYEYQGTMQSFEQIYGATRTTQTFVDPRLHLDYGSLDVFVNHGVAPWQVQGIGGINYTIPEDGWVAYDSRDGFVSFSAMPAGVNSRIDYCLAPQRYEMFNGRGAVNGYGGIVTGAPGTPGLLQVRNFAANSVVHEKVQVQLPSGFWLPSWEVVPLGANPIVRIALRSSQRAMAPDGWGGVQAIATHANGAWSDVTTKVDWTISNPALATIDHSGTIRGRGLAGNVVVSCAPLGGVSPSPFRLALR